jgi:hypothetical protein
MRQSASAVGLPPRPLRRRGKREVLRIEIADDANAERFA